MKKLLTILGLVLLVGCGHIAPVEIAELEYKQALGKAVCAAVSDLNSRGLLADEDALTNEFDPLIQKFVKAEGYSAKDWLRAKAKYFPDEEEHNKLIKLHFTWCLIGDSMGE